MKKTLTERLTERIVQHALHCKDWEGQIPCDCADINLFRAALIALKAKS